MSFAKPGPAGAGPSPRTTRHRRTETKRYTFGDIVAREKACLDHLWWLKDDS